MEKNKIKLDRIRISSEEIKSKQNFNEVLSKYNQAQVPVTKNPWFWGSAGLASLGLLTVLTLNAFPEFKTVEIKEKTVNPSILPEDTKCISPPIKGHDIKSTQILIDNSKDEKIILKSGTVITIEKGSIKLLNSSNTIVSLELREFRDHAERFLSGIPLDKDGKAFESAGMIEIRGKQGVKALEIIKPIQIDLVTNQDASNFKLWFLDEEKKDWVNHSKKETITFQKNDTKNLEIKKSQLVNTLTENNQRLYRLIAPSKNAYLLPEQNLPKFNLDFDKNKYPELASFSNLIFQAQTDNSAEFNKNRKKTWSSIELIKKNESGYLASFKNKTENYTIEVKPILQGEELKKAEKEFEKALENYKQEKENTSKQNDKLLKEKTVIEKQIKELVNYENTYKKNTTRVNRVSFEITNWGVFNSDNTTSYPKASKEDFTFLWNSNTTVQLKQLFVFDTEKNVRYNYGEGYRSIENLGFSPNQDEFHIVCIDKDQNLGYCYYKLNEQNKVVFKDITKSTSLLELFKKLFNENSSIS